MKIFKDSCKNRSPYEICDSNADCIYDMKMNDYICKCKSGYEGNGLRSKFVMLLYFVLLNL